MTPSIRLALAGLFAVGVAGGCKRTPACAEVDGLVTLDGDPLPDVVVTFYPVVEGADGKDPANDAKDKLPQSSAATDQAGRYVLKCDTGKPGAVPGKHRVVVTPPFVRESDDAPPPTGPKLPLRYASVGQTPLEVEVKAGPRQTIDLPVKTR